jgi:hypothetical protein
MPCNRSCKVNIAPVPLSRTLGAVSAFDLADVACPLSGDGSRAGVDPNQSQAPAPSAVPKDSGPQAE